MGVPVCDRVTILCGDSVLGDRVMGSSDSEGHVGTGIRSRQFRRSSTDGVFITYNHGVLH